MPFSAGQLQCGPAILANLLHLWPPCPMIFEPTPMRRANSSAKSLSSAGHPEALLRNADLSYI
jgi:hypothetical protein